MLETNFEQCALVSGLITQEQLESAWKEMRGTGIPQAEEIPGRLADILVNRSVLNRWQSQQLLAGRTRFTLGSYKIYDSIGHGGMGQVFKARHVMLDRIVAVKVLPLEKSTPQAIENFQNEIQSLASLNHKNLVQAIDAGMDGNVYYLVTEYVSGPDLRRLVRSRGPLMQESAASIIVQTACGLGHAHQAGLVHRDIKPGNILVTMAGDAKLSDLGLASSTNHGTTTKPNKIVGTADYISPDQVRDPGHPLPVWDIYALGCTLYYIVTGKVPYPGGTPQEKVKAHLDENTQPLDPCRLNPLLSRDFVDVIGDMMAKNPNDRIPSTEEVIRALEPWSDGTPREIEIADTDSSQSIVFPKNEQGENFFPVMARPEPTKPNEVPAYAPIPASAATEMAIPPTVHLLKPTPGQHVPALKRAVALPDSGAGMSQISRNVVPPPPPAEIPGRSVTKWNVPPPAPENAAKGDVAEEESPAGRRFFPVFPEISEDHPLYRYRWSLFMASGTLFLLGLIFLLVALFS
ncbi:MAG: protein kinase [Planctomycetia bacterium]|nr:protein kinase [Planctomycetia bacterium]